MVCRPISTVDCRRILAGQRCLVADNRVVLRVRLVRGGVLDLAAALLIASFINMVLIALHTQLLVEPKQFFNAIGGALAPGLFYVLVAAPYVSDLIAITIWVLIHLNVITLVHLRFGLPYAEVVPLVTPGYVVALVLIALLFRSSWRRSYDRLASEFRA